MFYSRPNTALFLILDVFSEKSYHLSNYKYDQGKFPILSMKNTRALIYFLMISTSFQVCAANDPLDRAINDTVKVQKDSRQSQETINKLADTTQDMLQEYRNTLQQTDSLKSYNSQLEKIISNQKETLTSISKQLDGVEDIQRNIVPLMLRMVAVLEKFINLDMPFLREERQSRLQTIKDMMDRSDVSLPDKYRRIMEAYQIEIGYGRTIDTNNDTIEIDGKKYTVNLLRIGRVALLYQTLDGKESGYWDKQSRTWKQLPDEYNDSIAKGILIADKKSPPDLFKIPVQAPVTAK